MAPSESSHVPVTTRRYWYIELVAAENAVYFRATTRYLHDCPDVLAQIIAVAFRFLFWICLQVEVFLLTI